MTFLNNSLENNSAFRAAAKYLRLQYNLKSDERVQQYFEEKFNCRVIYSHDAADPSAVFRGVEFDSEVGETLFL